MRPHRTQRRAALAGTLSAGLLASATLANTITIPLSSFTAAGPYDHPGNAVAAFRFGAGATVTGLSWNLTLTTAGQSRADESVVCLYAAANPAILDLRPFECEHAPGIFTNAGGPVALSATPAAGPQVWGARLVAPTGLVYLQAWDTFDDLTAGADGVFTGSISLEFTPPPCPADLDDGNGSGLPDGAVTIDDLLFFLGAYEQGSLGADLDDGSGTATPDQAVTIDDLVYMLIRFENGC